MLWSEPVVHCTSSGCTHLLRHDQTLITLTPDCNSASSPPPDTSDLSVRVSAGGYGSSAVNLLRRLGGSLEFPLTLGRDVSGEVVAVGGGVSRFRPGDQVWAAIGPQRQGTHAEFVTAAAGSVSDCRGGGGGAGVTFWVRVR